MTASSTQQEAVTTLTPVRRRHSERRERDALRLADARYEHTLLVQRRDRLAAALDEPPFEEADGPREHRHAQHLAQRVAILVEQVGDVQAEARILGRLEQQL